MSKEQHVTIARQYTLSRLRRGAVEGFLLRAAGVGLLFLMHSVLGRAIGPQGYGVFSYALALAGVLALVVPLGWTTALMRFVAQYVEEQQWGLLRGIMMRTIQVTAASATLIAVALWLLSNWVNIENNQITSLRFAAVLLPLLAFVGLRRKAFRGLQQVKASIIPEDILLPLLVVSGVFLLGVTTASHALMVYIAAAGSVFILATLWLWQSMPEDTDTAAPEFRTRIWLTAALPIVFGEVSQIVVDRTDVLMLGTMSDMGTVGVYSAAIRIAKLSTFVQGAVNIIAAPMLAAAFHGSHLEEFRAIVRRSVLWSTLGALPLFASVLFWPEELLGFFGPEFGQGVLLLRVLALGHLVNAGVGPIGFGLLMTGREREFALATGGAAVINTLGNFAAIPNWGGLGAAVVKSIDRKSVV